MTNLTISLDESIVRGARIRAIQEGTSLSAKVREFLRQYVEDAAPPEVQLRQSATQRLLASMDKASAASAQTAPVKADGTSLRDAMYGSDFRARVRQPRVSFLTPMC